MRILFKPLVIVIILTISVFGFVYFKGNTKKQNEQVTPRAQTQNVIIKVPVNGEVKNYDASVFVGKTVIEAMTDVGITFKVSGEGENSFVISIENYEVDAKKREFWEFLVNGKQAEIGAGTYIIKPNDQIEWKLSNY